MAKLNGRSHNYVRFLQAHVASEPKPGTALPPPPPPSKGPGADHPVDPNRVLVMNLPLHFSDHDIAAVFEPCGRVSGIERIVPADSGMFEGCAYVSFGNAFRSDETRVGVLAMDGTIPQVQAHGPAAAAMAAAMGGAAISVLPDPMGADHLDSWTVLVNKPTKFTDEQCQVLKQQFATRCGGHRIEFQKKLTQTQVRGRGVGLCAVRGEGARGGAVCGVGVGAWCVVGVVVRGGVARGAWRVVHCARWCAWGWRALLPHSLTHSRACADRSPTTTSAPRHVPADSAAAARARQAAA